MIKHVTKENFEKEVLKCNNPVLVDFFATWCGPCKMLAPVLEKISNEQANFEIAKVDIDESIDLAQEYKVEVVPTMIFIKQGQVISRLEGLASESEILEFVNGNM